MNIRSVLSRTLFVSFIFSSSMALAATDALENCYKTSERGQFFVYELEDIAKDGATPVLLLNAQQQVVGVISVSPKRLADGKANTVTVNKIEFCSSLETDSFYYAEDVAENLLTWVGADDGAVQISQDEGLLVVNVKDLKKEEYATLVRAEYKAYDVFNDDEDVNTPENRNKPDFIEDWGTPKGKGEFYFYIPQNWSLK